MFQGAHHVANVSLGRVVQEAGQLELGRQDGCNEDGVLRDRVVSLAVSTEAADIRKRVRYVGNINIGGVRVEGPELPAGVGEEPVAGTKC